MPLEHNQLLHDAAPHLVELFGAIDYRVDVRLKGHSELPDWLGICPRPIGYTVSVDVKVSVEDAKRETEKARRRRREPWTITADEYWILTPLDLDIAPHIPEGYGWIGWDSNTTNTLHIPMGSILDPSDHRGSYAAHIAGLRRVIDILARSNNDRATERHEKATALSELEERVMFALELGPLSMSELKATADISKPDVRTVSNGVSKCTFARGQVVRIGEKYCLKSQREDAA